MPITVEATYENGSLKLSQPLPLKEQEKVRVTVEQQFPSAAPESAQQAEPLLGDEIAAMVAKLPPEVIAKWPTDGASQHDHYLYGIPKRPERA